MLQFVRAQRNERRRTSKGWAMGQEPHVKEGRRWEGKTDTLRKDVHPTSSARKAKWRAVAVDGKFQLLPLEILLHICFYLDVPEVLRLSEVSYPDR